MNREHIDEFFKIHGHVSWISCGDAEYRCFLDEIVKHVQLVLPEAFLKGWRR